MNILTFKVDGLLPGEVTFELQRPAGSSLSYKIQTELTIEAIRTDPSSLNLLLPPDLTRELRQQVVSGLTPDLLAIISANDLVDGIPWEYYLPKLLKVPTVFVVRQLGQSESFVEEPAPRVVRLLAAGWSGKPRFQLPGIQKELMALNQLKMYEDFQVQLLFEPNLETFYNACSTFLPDILHLIPPGIAHDIPVPEIILSGDEPIKGVPMDHFLSGLPPDLRPRLVVLNTCSGGEGGSGPSAIRIIAKHLRSMVIGWLGEIQDLVAVDFARFIYARILDGESVIDALRAYRAIQISNRNFEQATRNLMPALFQRPFDTVPVVLTPSIELLIKPLRDLHYEEVLHAQKPRALSAVTFNAQPSRAQAELAVSSDSSFPAITVEFEPQKWLNPALLKNGRPAINRLVLNPDRALYNVGVAVSCDTGNGISTVRQTLNLEKGPQPVPIDTWQFPVLYELIGAAVPRRQINFTVSCSLAGGLLAETTMPVTWMGRTEWLDKEDTWHFIPAFVDPNSDRVLDVIGHADDILKKIESPTSRFDAYQSGDSQHVINQVKAIFNCLRDKPYELRYIAPPPIPVFAGEVFASGQRIRPLEEIIDRCRGTCHDLAILFGSCLEQIQIYPLIILITGHTFFGFWKDSGAHDKFWNPVGKKLPRPSSDLGRQWTIRNRLEIDKLLNRNVISLVDAVKVTDRNAKFEDAVQEGFKYFQQTSDRNSLRKFDVAVDIQASRCLIQPL